MRFLDWVILGLLGFMFVLVLYLFLRATGEGQVGFLGWLAILVGIAIYAGMVVRHPSFQVRKLVDLLLVVTGATAYALFQGGIMVLVFREDRSPLGWMTPLIAILSVIGLTLYRYR